MGCIRDPQHAYFKDGGLAVLTGNIAEKGCIVKTAGVDESLFVFRGQARVFESQEQAMNGIRIMKSKQEMLLSSAMKVPKEVLACRKCFILLPI